MTSLTDNVTRHLANSLRPHYVFRPRQLVQRVTSDLQPQPAERRLPLLWGSELICNPRDPIGEAVLRRGVFDLLVCETLWRLTDPGETAVDAGANVGHMTSLLARMVGDRGRVVAFEPHPTVFDRLRRNADTWNTIPSWGEIEPREAAVSDSDGTATLATDAFAVNQGAASLEPMTPRDSNVDQHTVRTLRLEDALGRDEAIGVLKIDVEGHELAALRGAERLLSSGRIRDIVFEEREPAPTPVTRLLDEHGYTVMQLGERLRGPVIAALGATDVGGKDDPSLLATRAPQRAVHRLGVRGWAVYGVGPAARTARPAVDVRSERSSLQDAAA